MISLKDFEDVLTKTGIGYFIHTTQYVPDITAWARENNQELSEPHIPMKLMSTSDDALTMVMQSEVQENIIDDVIKNLSVRWSIRDNCTDIDKKLNSTKKRLVFCFLKERAQTMKDIGGDELIEDQWVIDEMEGLGFFNE